MQIETKGYITCTINKSKVIKFPNHVLDTGKKFLASCLLLQKKELYIANILFGDGGTLKGVPKEVNGSMQQLFGVTRLKKPTISQIDPEMPTRVIFSVVIGEDECNYGTLNEMGLELSNGELFSLSTFTDLNKDSNMELSWGWEIVMV